jgi:fucose 4-O-acetylase-like acetyltransferase
MARATSAGRDRYVDFLRVLSLGLVVVGHWLATLVWWEEGAVRGENGLNVLPEMWPLTWLFQVMPLFFFVGGFANRKSYESAVRRGGGYAAYVTSRLQRLLIPTLVFLAVGLTIAIGLDVAGLMDETLRPAARVVTLPLWFLGVYLMVVALAPPMLALHRRVGARLVVGMVGAAVVVDMVRFALDVDDFGHINYALVWLAVHQLGFLYADGVLHRWAAALSTAGAATLMGLVAWGPYPASLVGISGSEIDNMNPPTLVILALAATQVGVALLVRHPVSRWLGRVRPWAVVVVLNRRVMTMFLWHLAAILPTIAVIYPLGFPQPEPGSLQFWLLRPIWIVLQIPVLVGMVLLFGRFETVGRQLSGDLSGEGDSPSSRIVAAVGAFLAGLGILGYARLGLEPFYSDVSKDLTIIDVNSARSLTYLLLAAGLLWAAVRGPDAACRAARVGAAALVVIAMLGLSGTPLYEAEPAETAVQVVGALTLAVAARSSRGSLPPEGGTVSRGLADTPASGSR